MGQGGTYPDLAMAKGLELAKGMKSKYEVKTSTKREIDILKRAIH